MRSYILLYIAELLHVYVGFTSLYLLELHDTCEDTGNCTVFVNHALCYSPHILPSAAKYCPKTCKFCRLCTDEDSQCIGLLKFCNKDYVLENCRRTCGACSYYNPDTFIQNYHSTVNESLATSNIQLETTQTTIATTTTELTTTPPPLSVKPCDKFGVIVAIATASIATSAFSSPCSDGQHQHSEDVVQKYCAAPDVTKWQQGVNVLENCNQIPHYTPIAGRPSVFAGTTLAAVFIRCTDTGFEAAFQTCDSVLKIHQITSNSTASVPSADKFVLLDWNN